jgi:hypothetical protein
MTMLSAEEAFGVECWEVANSVVSRCMDGNSEISLWPFAVFIQDIPTSTKKERRHIVLGLFVYAGPVNPTAVTESVFAQLLLLCQKQAPVKMQTSGLFSLACWLRLLMLSYRCYPFAVMALLHTSCSKLRCSSSLRLSRS